MNSLKICFVGIGSIARRHIRNLSEVCKSKGMRVKIDAFRRADVHEEDIDRVYTNISDVPDDYDIIFITNPTEYHLETLERFHDKGRFFFIEKPVVSTRQVERARKIALRDDSIYYIACPLRYNPVIQWIKENVHPEDVISARSISSSYLPKWRLGRDYRSTYSARKDMGGGVSVDLIHEWDYLTYLFEWPQKVYSIIGKKSDLEIDSDDNALYIAEYKRMTVELHLDYYGRKAIRQIQLFTRYDTVVGDLIENTITRLVSGEQIVFEEERDDYQKRELEYFLDLIDGNTSKIEMENCGFRHALKVLELTQGRIR